MRNARTVTARTDRLARSMPRVFGALRNVVRVDPSFFDPLPIAELDAWEGSSKKKRAPTTVRVCSAKEAARLRPSSRSVVIAIRDPGAPIVRLRSGWKAVLSLEVPDVSPSGELMPGVNLTYAGEAIAKFLAANRKGAGIVVHCHLGVSRSRSIAAAICEAFAWPYQWTVLHEPLYTAVLAALERSQESG